MRASADTPGCLEMGPSDDRAGAGPFPIQRSERGLGMGNRRLYGSPSMLPCHSIFCNLAACQDDTVRRNGRDGLDMFAKKSRANRPGTTVCEGLHDYQLAIGILPD